MILKIENVNNYFKKTHILKDITFSIKKGSFHAFVGENGAGKTTTMCLISGILNDYNGTIKFNNESIHNVDNKSILFIPERVSFPMHMTALQFVDSFSSFFTNKKNDKTKIEKLFAEFDISDIKNRKANKLSSGQKKKISLIRAIISKPKLLLIDEPAANLDPTSRIKLFESLKELNEKGTTIFISSHIISELERYVDSATIIKKGKIIWTGNVDKNILNNKYKEKVINQVGDYEK